MWTCRPWLQQYLPFTVLKLDMYVTTLLQVLNGCNSTYRLRYWNSNRTYRTKHITFELQQYLPFTVLKPFGYSLMYTVAYKLQQYLPFTVLKHSSHRTIKQHSLVGRLQQYLPFTVLKRCQILIQIISSLSCNSTYRLRYWNIPPC